MTDKSFINWSSFTDDVLASQIGLFVKNHRVRQQKTQDELAGLSGISRSTLSQLERGETVTIATLIQVLRVLNQLDVLMSPFVVKQELSPLEQLRLQKKTPQRVRKSANAPKKIKESYEVDW